MAKRENRKIDKKVEPKKEDIKIQKKIEKVEELVISLSAYFVRAGTLKHEWYPRKVYALKHIKEEKATFKKWEELFKKY